MSTYEDTEDLKMDEPEGKDADESEEHGTVVPDSETEDEGDDDGGT